MEYVLGIAVVAYFGNNYLTKRRREAAAGRKDEAEASLNKLKAELEADIARCKDGVSHFIVTRNEDKIELKLPKSREDVEVNIAKGEHVFKSGRGGHPVEFMHVSQAGSRGRSKHQAYVEEDTSSD